MVKTKGTRNSGKAQLWWTKTEYSWVPLGEDELNYLSELARVRKQLTDGKTRSEDRLDHLEGRQIVCEGILGDYGIEVRYPNTVYYH